MFVLSLVIPNSVVSPAPAKLFDSPPLEQFPDSLSISGPDGNVIRLPAYSKGAIPMKLTHSGQFEIKAQSLFPNLDRLSGSNQLVSRFAVTIVNGGHTVYQRRYSAHETSLAQALATALRWISARRSQERWKHLCSWPLLCLWTFSVLAGWLFEPIVGWLSYLPLLVGFPFSFYFAPPLAKSRQMTASIGGFN